MTYVTNHSAYRIMNDLRLYVKIFTKKYLSALLIFLPTSCWLLIHPSSECLFPCNMGASTAATQLWYVPVNHNLFILSTYKSSILLGYYGNNYFTKIFFTSVLSQNIIRLTQPLLPQVLFLTSFAPADFKSLTIGPIVLPRTMESSMSTIRLPLKFSDRAPNFFATPSCLRRILGWMNVLPTYRFLHNTST